MNFMDLAVPIVLWVGVSFGLWSQFKDVEGYEELETQNAISEMAWNLHLPWRALLGGRVEND